MFTLFAKFVHSQKGTMPILGFAAVLIILPMKEMLLKADTFREVELVSHSTD
jgi:hypothetical protein